MSTNLDFFASIALDNAAALDGGLPLYVTTRGDGQNYRSVSGTNTYFRPVLRVGTFLSRFASPRSSVQLPSTVDIEIVNRDGWVNQYLGLGANSKIWDNRTVTLKYGGSQGSDWAAMSTEFVGKIKRGSLVHTEASVKFTLYDTRASDDKPILSTKFGTGATVHDEAKGRYIPKVWGDFTDAPLPDNGGGPIRAFCINTLGFVYQYATNQTQMNAFSDVSVYHHDVSAGTVTLLTLTTDYTLNAYNSQITIAVAYRASVDVDDDFLTVKCRAGTSTVNLPSNGYTATDRIEYAADMIYHLLKVYGGVGSNIDTASFTTAHNDSDKALVRRALVEQESVMAACGQIAWENNMYLYVANDGRYTLRYNLPSVTVSATVRDDQPAVNTVSAIYDPDGIYANEISVRYSLTRLGEEEDWLGSLTYTASDEQTAYGSTVSTDVDMFWIYNPSDATRMAQRWGFAWASRAHNVEVTLVDKEVSPSGTFWRLALSNVIQLTAWAYTSSAIQIVQIRRDGTTGRVTILGMVAEQAYQVGQWEASSAPPTTVTYPIRWADVNPGVVHPEGRWC